METPEFNENIRIGNYLRNGNFICKVIEITRNGNVYVTIGKDIFVIYHSDVQFLTLSEAILAKIDKNQRMIFQSLGWLHEIRYLHDLQNKWEDTFHSRLIVSL